MTLEDLEEICGLVGCEVGDVQWHVVTGDMGKGFYVQLQYLEPDVVTGKLETQYGRKWYISPHTTKSEVVQTILKAALTSAEHMIREHFTYRGVTIFGPHFDVDSLVEAQTTGVVKIGGRD